MPEAAQVLEAIMVIAFGVSWPVSIIKAYRSKSTKGKSLLFLLLIDFGYICGIVGKIVGENITWVFVLYILNLVMVSWDIVLYLIHRNKEKLYAERQTGASAKGKEGQ